jgi:DNA-directed RNA polymerase sigma subunit (sigma70/sigma32)
MSAREQKIIELRFGLKDGVRHTLRDIAKRFDLTRERVRQLEAVAKRKLRDALTDQGEKAQLLAAEDKKKLKSGRTK